jgi:hypothetical protein
MGKAVNPKVTVLMPMYNGGRYLLEAVESILAQTYVDFDFLIINDGSNDNSVEIIESFTDPRIKLIHNERNIGLIETLNRGIDLAKGEYIARMDCDDISLPARLIKQVRFLEKHTDIGICGTWIIRRESDVMRPIYLPSESHHVRCGLLFASTLAHPTVMFRKEYFMRHSLLYDTEYSHAEDYDLWVRMSRHFPMCNIPSFLLEYRVHPGQVGYKCRNEQMDGSRRIWQRQLEAMGLHPEKEDLDMHQCISTLEFVPSVQFLENAEDWMRTLLHANRTAKIYPEPVMTKFLVERWMKCSRKVYGDSLVSVLKAQKTSLFSKQAICADLIHSLYAKARYGSSASGVG